MSAKSVAKLYQEAVYKGLCTRCRKADPAPGLKSCRACLDRKYKADKREGWPSTRTAPVRRMRRKSTPKPEPAPDGKIWELPWNGKYWYDMPGADFDIRKMNFFFFRRGEYDPLKDVIKRWGEKPKFYFIRDTQ